MVIIIVFQLSSFSGVTTFSGTSSFSGNSNLGGNANFSQTPNFGTPNFSGTPNVGMTSSFPTGSENMSKSWSLMGMANSVTPLSPSVSGPVSVANQGWDIKPQEMRKYVMEFNTLDVSKTGYISGMYVEVYVHIIVTWTDLSVLLISHCMYKQMN